MYVFQIQLSKTLPIPGVRAQFTISSLGSLTEHVTFTYSFGFHLKLRTSDNCTNVTNVPGDW